MTIKELEELRDNIMSGEIDENQCRDILYDLITEKIEHMMGVKCI